MLVVTVLLSLGFLVSVGLLLAPVFGVNIIPGWGFAACAVFSAIATYQSAAKLAHVHRFLRSFPA